MSDYRMTIGPIVAARSLREAYKPRASNAVAALGLRYERKVKAELLRLLANNDLVRVEHNPWFTFSDTYGTNNCCPDFILWRENGLIVVEVKLTWVPIALAKLHDLYLPVVAQALDMPVLPLVICRNTTPMAPRASFSVRDALASEGKLLQWPTMGRIQW